MNENQLRKIYTALLGLVVLVIITSAASAYYQTTDNLGTVIKLSEEDTQTNVIKVSGTGTISMPPDKGIIYVGIRTQSADAATAQQTNADITDAVIKALKDAGIAEEDIITSNYHMYPIRDYEQGYETITGYVVSNQLEVTIKDIDTIGEIIDIAVEAGANDIRGVSFTLSDEKQQDARKKALDNAVQAARSDADVLASALNVTIQNPVELSTSGGYYNSPYMKDVSVVREEGATTPIQPGDVSVYAYVQVMYQFE